MVSEVAVNPRIKWVGGDGNYHGDNQVNMYSQGIGMYRMQFRCSGRVSLRGNSGRDTKSPNLAPLQKYSPIKYPASCQDLTVSESITERNSAKSFSR